MGGQLEVFETKYMINFGFSSHPEINVRWSLDLTDRTVCPLDSFLGVALAFRLFESRGRNAYKEGGDGGRRSVEVRDTVLSSEIRDCVEPTAVLLNRQGAPANFCACTSDDRLDEASEVSDVGEATGDPRVAFAEEASEIVCAEDIDFALRKNVVFGPEGGS